MSSSKLISHRDVDSEIMPLDNDPMALFWRLIRLAALAILVVSWFGLIALWAAGVNLPWSTFIWLPLTMFVVLIALPALWISRRAALAILDALAKTAEAWLARAGWSIDINNDGVIGHQQPIVVEPPQERITTPVLYNSGSGTRLLAKDAPVAIGDGNVPLKEQSPAPTTERMIVDLWQLPNGVKCPKDTVAEFCDQIFIRGFNRGVWVPKEIDRDTYDGLILLFAAAKIIVDRKERYAGRLGVKNARQARMVLNLPIDSEN